MSQQTLIYNFYKSVNPQRQFNKEPVTITAKISGKTITKRRKALSLERIKMEPSVTVTPKKPPKRSFNQTQINSEIELNDVSDDEAIPMTIEIKTPKLSREVSFENNLPSTPTSDAKSGKGGSSARGSGSTSSSRKRLQSNGSRTATKHLKHRTPKRLFHNETLDFEKVSEMVENLNSSRVGILPKNNFDLEKFYLGINSETEVVNCDINEISPVYDINRVIIPREKHAEHLFNIIVQVFLIPINCGYFNHQELDLVFNILSLSEKAQMLLARMIKRKYCWKRSAFIKYPEIADNLKPYFDELEKNKLITSNMEYESLETILPMLLADEAHIICRQSKIPRQSNKDLAIEQLLKTSSHPLFPGMASPATVLRKTVLNTLDHCVCLPKSVVSLFDRIVTLFSPSEDVSSKISDIFLKLTLIKEGTVRYPEVPLSEEHYPVFQNREHLLRYVERKNEWRQVMEMPKADEKTWEIFRTIGREAHTRLILLLERNGSSQQLVATPRHVQKFKEEYICIKIITNCIEIFKKESSTLEEAVAMLRNLMSQEKYLQSRKSEWYEELALIEMSHKKNPEAAALLTIEGFSLQNITETGRHILIKRASTLARRKAGINTDIKSQLKTLVDQKVLSNAPTVSINANVMQGNHPGRKSTWSLDMGGGDKGYMSVEYRAQYYYKNNGYPEGWHCEGSLPVTLFTLLFWEELYCIPVPAAYLSAHQRAPLDLYTSDFYNNRKEQIENKKTYINSLSADQLASSIEESLETRQHYESLMPTILHISSQQLKDIVRCMGTSVVLGICERLASNFSEWRAGFPDLLVWNPITLKCKFVEVKGPKDTLSAKQTLWLRYLANLGAVTELCEVKAK